MGMVIRVYVAAKWLVFTCPLLAVSLFIVLENLPLVRADDAKPTTESPVAPGAEVRKLAGDFKFTEGRICADSPGRMV